MMAILAVLLFASTAIGQTYTAYSPNPPRSDGISRLASGETCTACEYGPVKVVSGWYQTVVVDCVGACDVQLGCRLPGQVHDVPMFNAQPVDGPTWGTPPFACPSAFFRIKSCQPTATSPECKVWAWLF